MTVADYCQAMARHEIDVNRDYQRSDRVWPPAAKSFLIESILLNYPVPKLSLYQVTDRATRITRKEIVDGQQRSVAIFEFFSNVLRLSRTLELDEAAGRTYEQLPGDLQDRFLDYGLSVDLFLAATPEEVREAFRRINSYTVPLNPEEQRHALYQGPFKWFIHRLSRDFDATMLAMGVFGQKQIVRMADSKLWTEVCDALLNGVSTTDKRKLDRLYRSKDVDFPEQTVLDERIRRAVAFLVDLPEIHRTELAKPYQMYSLILASTHFREAAETLADDVPLRGAAWDRDSAIAGLAALADAAENQDDEGPYGEFVEASTSKTNVADQRLTRIRWIVRALEGDLAV
jgi:Protein of unknown function DUF262